MRNTLFQFVLRPLVRGLVMMGCGSVWAAPPVPTQLPTGGEVVAGKAAIAQSGSLLNVNQSSQRAAIDWQSFNVGAAAQVNFNQPSRASVTLNRVLDNNPSQIFGRITAPGQVFLVNPAGAYFAPSASVEVGSLMATTHSLSNEDFMAGRSTLLRNGATGRIVNEGQLNASMEGYIALLAPEVRNNGVVVAQMGTVVLAAGEAYTLQFDGAGLLPNVVVTPATINALVENGNAVQAPGGLIILSAQAASRLQGGMVNNTGSLQASGLVKEGGRILLRASDQISHSGSMQADAALGSAGQGGNITLIADLNNPDSVTRVSGSISAKGGTLGGDGGFVETSASRLKIADSSVIDTLAIRGKNGQWLLDPYDFTIAKSGGDLTGSVLSAALENNSVTIQTTDSNATCNIATCGSGNSAGNGDIVVNDVVSWGSPNTLTLNAWRNIAINANMTSSAGKLALVYGQKAVAANNDATISIGTNTQINLSAGPNYSTRLGSNGTTENWRVITELGSAKSNTPTDLQGIKNNLGENYLLGADIDASSTKDWNDGAGFLPFGDNSTQFRGKFDGLGHTIRGLVVNRPDSENASLFGWTIGATIRNVGLVDVDINGLSDVGGLVGFAHSSSISRSFVTGKVFGEYIGGLAGRIANSRISQSYATASVSGNAAGGLVSGASEKSFIDQSFATGKVTGGGSNNGGLVGYLDNSSVRQSYATGEVSNGGYMNGGLVGYAENGSSIIQSYASGAVSGVGNNGGLVGGINSATVTDSYWNTETSGQSGSAGGDGVKGLTTARLNQFSRFTGWDIANAGGTDKVWRIYEGQTTPLLKAFLTNITLSGTGETKTYNGEPQKNSFVATVGTIYNDDITAVDGLVTRTNAGTTTSVGTLSNAQGKFYKYDISYGGGGSLTIDKAPLEIKGLSATDRPYNRSNEVALTGTGILSGTVYAGDEGLILAGSRSTTGTLGSANAGLQTVTVNSLGYSLEGSAKSNYQLISNLKVNISQADVTLSDIQKTYDGTSGLGNTTMTIAGVGTEKLGFSAATYYSKDVSANGSNYLSALKLENGSYGEKESNYKLPALNRTNAEATINKAPLTLAGTNATGTYNGGVQTNRFNAAAGRIYNNDIESVSGLATGTSASPARYSGAAQLSNAQGSGVGNYDINYGEGGSLKIDKADYTAISASKTYNGNADFSSAKLIGVNDEQFSVSSLTANSANASSNGGASRFTGFSGGISGVSTAADTGNYNTLVLSSLSDSANQATINKAPLILSGTNATVTYNGLIQSNDFTAIDGTTIYNNDITSVSGLATGRNASSTSYSGAAPLSNAQGSGIGNYEISYGAGGSLTITKAPLTISATSQTRQYSGDTTSSAAPTYGTLFGTDSLSGLTQSYASKNVLGENQSTLNVNKGYSLNDGNGGRNYEVTLVNAAGTITPAKLNITGVSVANKVYDGARTASLSGGDVQVFGNDDVTLVKTAVTGTFDTKDAGSAKLVSAKGYTLSGSDVSNYALIQPTELLAAITPKALTIAAKNDFRTYDSMAYSGGNGVTYSGFVTGESESALSGTLAYGGTSQGAVRAGTYSISPRGLTSNNYSIEFVDGQLTIAIPVSTIVTGGCATASLAATGPNSMACYTQNMQIRRARSFEQFDVDAKQ